MSPEIPGRRGPAPKDFHVRKLGARPVVLNVNDEPIPMIVLEVVEQDITTGGPGRELDIFLPIEAAISIAEAIPEFAVEAAEDARSMQSNDGD